MTGFRCAAYHKQSNVVVGRQCVWSGHHHSAYIATFVSRSAVEKIFHPILFFADWSAMKPLSTYEIFFGPENRVVTLKLIRYSLLMLLIPLGTFYFMYYVIFEKRQEMLGWSGIAAVVATNCVIAAYVVMAWNEDDNEEMSPSKVPGKAKTPAKKVD